MDVWNPRFYRRVALAGGVGVAESLADGDWECSDLTALVRVFVRNLQSADTVNSLPSSIRHSLERFAHFLKRNTIGNAKQNIVKHYDLSNEFFELFLDETMTYSSGIFSPPGISMRDASMVKIDRACRMLDLKPTDHLLEIGTGWGALAIRAAENYGCKVTTTTISDQQYDYAKQRIHNAGLTNQIELLRHDYRQLEGNFDKLVSIEMIEAVGHQYFDTFFGKCAELLKPSGEMLIQAITIVDHRFEHHRRSVDFIKRFIFPGGCLPSTTALMQSMARSTRMRLVQFDDFAGHYAETLRCWRSKYLSQLDAVRQLGFDDRFIRLWEYYFAYCEAAFLERNVNVSQMLLANHAATADTINRGSRNRKTGAEESWRRQPSLSENDESIFPLAAES